MAVLCKHKECIDLTINIIEVPSNAPPEKHCANLIQASEGMFRIALLGLGMWYFQRGYGTVKNDGSGSGPGKHFGSDSGSK